MKAKLHFPTEQYGFVEIEAEVASVEEGLDLYKASTSPNLPSGGGLEQKEWNDTLTEYLNTTELRGGATTYEALSDQQRWTIQELKQAFKRVRAKDERESIEVGN